MDNLVLYAEPSSFGSGDALFILRNLYAAPFPPLSACGGGDGGGGVASSTVTTFFADATLPDASVAI
jgi:hypothetical protein